MTTLPFGPFYPAPIRAAVEHADRFTELLATSLERRGSPAVKAWLVGRTSEVTCFVSQVVREWDSRALDDASVAIAIEEYLRGLHAALARLGVESLACCSGEDEITSVPVAVTDEIPAAPASGSGVLDAADADVSITEELDPTELLAGLDTQASRMWE